MKTSLDCIPCLVRQALEAARLACPDPELQERALRDALRLLGEEDLDLAPPALAQLLHRRLRRTGGSPDPYRRAKIRLNSLALALLPELERELAGSPDPLGLAVRLAIAGNVLDMGVNAEMGESEVRRAVRRSLAEDVAGDLEAFRRAARDAGSILYLADNAGEIVFDRLLAERLPGRVAVAVRGAPVLNDATLEDALAAGFRRGAALLDNGSDAPGSLLADCSPEFRERFASAGMVLAKGQGNYETLCDGPREVFFLFKVKCPVIAARAGLPLGAHALVRSAGRHGGTP